MTTSAALVDVVDVASVLIDEFPKACWRICPTYKHDLADTMRLRQSARGVLKKLQPQQTKSKVAKTSRAAKTRYNVALTDPRGGDTTEEEVEPESSSARYREKAQRPAAAGKDVHNKMAHAAIAIHEDEQYDLSTDQVEEEDMAQVVSEEGDSANGSMSEATEDTEDEVDESVVEDMRRLEESFKGISQKYRLINRIGEGITPDECTSPCQC